MKRLVMVLTAWSALMVLASAQSIVVQPQARYNAWDGGLQDPSSVFSASWANGCLTLSDFSIDCRHPDYPDWYVPCGWSNRRHWYISLDGISPAEFDPDDPNSPIRTVELEVTFDLTPVMEHRRTVEAGLLVLERPFPRYPPEVNNQGSWWADGVLMVANEFAGGSGGEVAAFGGRLPFWAGGGVRYTGGPITLVFRYDGQQKRAQYEVRYGNTTATSPWLNPGDSSSNYNNGPHGLRFFRLGGYLQVNIAGQNGATDLPPNFHAIARWCRIKFNGKTILGPGSGDVNMDGIVDDEDLLIVLFNFGTGSGN